MRNFIKQFLCEHDYGIDRNDFYGMKVNWYKCRKCRHLVAFAVSDTDCS